MEWYQWFPVINTSLIPLMVWVVAGIRKIREQDLKMIQDYHDRDIKELKKRLDRLEIKLMEQNERRTHAG
jgi:hypothetical protein